jgi:NADH dehydrogenase/NADH:ubiquinone oxidoreductase subunit G
MGVHPNFLPGYAAAPERGLGAKEIFEAARGGRLAALALFGVNPLAHHPDRKLVETALAGVPFVVVSELFMTDTAACATLVLPARGGFEKDGHAYALDGSLVRVNAGIDPPGQTLSDGEMLGALAGALGIATFSPGELAERAAAPFPQSARGFAFGDERLAGVQAPPRPGYRGQHDRALEVLVGTRILAGAGTALHDAALGELRPGRVAALSPETALAFNLDEGDALDLAGEGGNGKLADLVVRYDRTVPPGAVMLIDGAAEAAPNKIGASHAAIENVRPARRQLAEAAR